MTCNIFDFFDWYQKVVGTHFACRQYMYSKICIIFLTAYPGAEYKVITPANIEDFLL